MFLCLKCRVGVADSQGACVNMPWMVGLTEARAGDNPNAYFREVCKETPAERIDQVSLLYFAELQTYSKHLCLTRLAREGALSTSADLANSAAALAECADAELGQQVLRELIVTFYLPRAACPPRKSVFLERNAMRRAEKEHANVLNHAYRTALQGPLNVWEKGVLCDNGDANAMMRSDFLDEQTKHERQRALASEAEHGGDDDLSKWYLERACVMLSAIAVNVYKDTIDARRRDAFGGVVEMPCFQRSDPLFHKCAPRLLLHNDVWTCYGQTERGSLEVHVKGCGLNALVACTACMVAKLTQLR